jgi:lipid-A-disaccharide synthase-like uncharacterized protein
LVKEKEVRGDKLKDLLFYVYMHDRFSQDKIKVADLKKIAGYKRSGVYGAFESSRYVTKENDEIHLTQEGKEYVESRILPRFDFFKWFGNMLILLGAFFLMQWYEWTYQNIPLLPTWYLAVTVFGTGFFLRFFVLRFYFFIVKRRRRMEYP